MRCEFKNNLEIKYKFILVLSEILTIKIPPQIRISIVFLMNNYSPTILKLFRSFLIFLLFVAPAVFADVLLDVKNLIKDREWASAINLIESELQKKPLNVQLHFLKALVFSKQDKLEESIKTYEYLTNNFPELAEPHNNLGVIFAKQNKLDKAQQSFEMAIRIRPDYANALENLGDVYLRLADNLFEIAQKNNLNGTLLNKKRDTLHSLIQSTLN